MASGPLLTGFLGFLRALVCQCPSEDGGGQNCPHTLGAQGTNDPRVGLVGMILFIV